MKGRLYNCSDVVMLLTSRIIVKNLSDNLTELSVIRTNWDSAYAESLTVNIDDTATNLLGKNSKTALFEATDNMAKVMAPARKALSSLKVQLDADFKKDASKHRAILNDLGYSAYFEKVHNRSQLILISFLTCFKRNIGIYTAEIVVKGTPVDLLNKIALYADVVKNANTYQEQLKLKSKDITAEVSAQLNNLYEEVSSLSKIAADHYKGNPIKKEMFTFSKIVSYLKPDTPKKTKEIPQAQTA